MIRRASILLAVVAVVALAVVSLPLAGDADQSDKGTAVASPESSPAASPAASPMASPGASPMAMAGDVASGEKLVSQCLACHTVDGKELIGPTWLGLYGSEVTMDDGTTVIADDAYLVESIEDPLAQIVEGYPPAMPPYKGILSEQDIADIIAYIKTLN